jgi:ABC-2 type transport system ATP-binding protein/ribosome-dependent ATPase
MIVCVRELKKRFKKKEIIKGVSFEVKKGEIFGLIGPDGAGKSTVMKIIAGVMSFEQGKVEVLGRDFGKEKEAERAKIKIAFMPQGLGLNLYHTLSVEENINFFATLHDLSKKELKDRKKALLEVTRLAPFRKREAQNLSGGMMQKLGVCCALIHKPELIILDEPTTGIDPVSRRDLWRLIVKFVKEEGIAAIISTSYMDEAECFSRLALMIDGKFVAEGTPTKLKEVCGNVYEVQKDIKGLYPLVKKKFKHVRLKGDTMRFLAEKEIERNALPVKPERVEPTLEDVFLTLQKEEEIDIKVPFTLKGKIPDPIVRVEKLTKKFDSFVAVKDVSFEIKSGEIFGLLGPNGAGKTTLIKMLCGLLPLTSGRFSVAGERDPQAVKEIIGYMSQRFSLYKDLTVYENLELYGYIYKVPSFLFKERIAWALESTRLKEIRDEKTEKLPLGVKQRLALMCSILHNPALVFLDEPTSSVDPKERKIFWEIIHVMAKEVGVTALVSTHYMDEAEYCDRLCLMDQGEAIAIGAPSKLKEETRHKIGHIYQITVDRPFLALDILEKNGLYASFYENGIRFYSKQTFTLDKFKVLFSPYNLKISDLKEVYPSMEDVFVYLVEERE